MLNAWSAIKAWPWWPVLAALVISYIGSIVALQWLDRRNRQPRPGGRKDGVK